MKQAAPRDPVARVMVDVPLAHLDRPFDYLIDTELDELVQPGMRVRVRFSGRLVDAYVLARLATSDSGAKLAFIERAVGTEPVLTTETSRLFRAVADRYAGSFIDVARLGVPPRHARAEVADSVPATVPEAPSLLGWGRYTAGVSFIAAIGSARPARAVWSALPGEDWPARLAEGVQAALAVGRGAVVVVPDARDLARLDAALTAALGAGRHVALSADLGPSTRYKRWLSVRREAVRAVIGTRAAAYAPVAELGFAAVWDDGDDLHREPRSPYPDVRDVLALRSAQTGAALLIGGFARTAEAQQLVDSGWAHDITATRDVVRSSVAQIAATGDDFEQLRDPAARAARLPSLAWRTARESLELGRPVLIQVPRSGYIPSLACARDRTPARCSICAGPLAATSGQAIATCRWCGHPAGDWACPVCGGRRLRAVAVGTGRTAEELGRAFPNVSVRTSGGAQVLASVEAGPALIVSTPGAEPVAAGGYGAALLLDGWALLARPDLRAGEEALRRWFNAAALVRSDGKVVIGAEASVPAVQALVRWDPAGAASRELAERGELHFPPAVRMASLTGTPAAVEELLGLADLPSPHEVIGPVSLEDDQIRTLVRVPREQGALLAIRLHQASGARSARKVPDTVRVMMDPVDLF